MKKLLLSALATGIALTGGIAKAEPVSHPFSIEDIMMAGTGAALVRNGYNTNPAADILAQKKKSLPYILVGVNAQAATQLPSLAESVGTIFDPNTSTKEDVQNKILDLENLKDSTFRLDGLLMPNEKLGNFRVGIYSMTHLETDVKAPKNLLVQPAEVNSDDLMIDMGNQGRVLQILGNSDVGAMISYAYPLYDKDDFAVAFSTTTRGFYRIQFDTNHVFPSTMNIDEAKTKLNFGLKNLIPKTGWGIGLDVGAFAKLTNYVSLGVTANDVYDYVSGVDGNTTNLEAGIAVHPLAFINTLKDVAVAMDIMDTLDLNQRRFEFGIEFPIRMGDDFAIIPRAGYSSAFAPSLNGDTVAAGLQLMLGPVDLHVAYNMNFNRELPDGRSLLSNHMVYSGIAWRM